MPAGGRDFYVPHTSGPTLGPTQSAARGLPAGLFPGGGN